MKDVGCRFVLTPQHFCDNENIWGVREVLKNEISNAT